MIRRVATFSELTPNNDPYGERDFGFFALTGHKFFFKRGYYDTFLNEGSEFPASPAKTIP